MHPRLIAIVLTSVFLVPGCGDDGGGTPDTGVSDSGGTDAGMSGDSGVAHDASMNTDAGGEAPFASCIGLDPICAGNSCCETRTVAGGTFPMGRSEAGTDAFVDGFFDEQPEHDVTVSSFALDRFEVTVGRMRQFVEQYVGATPAESAGAHALIEGTGWQSEWNGELPESRDALIAELADSELEPYCNWSNEPGADEAAAINCVSWYVAFAFCVWDGGRLPTEAEWEYASAGGDENRLYPWGSTEPADNLANYGGLDAYVSIPVGSNPDGAGRYGHDDLAGSMWEWVYDAWGESWYSTGGATCNDCANTSDVSQRSTYRGGAWTNGASGLRAAIRNNFSRHNTNTNIGFRCARDTE